MDDNVQWLLDGLYKMKKECGSRSMTCPCDQCPYAKICDALRQCDDEGAEGVAPDRWELPYLAKY